MKPYLFSALFFWLLGFSPAIFQHQSQGDQLAQEAWNAYEQGYNPRLSAQEQAEKFDEAAKKFEEAAKAYEAEANKEKAEGARKMARGARQNAEHRRKMGNVHDASHRQVRATGRTTGHVADVVLSNPGSKPVDVELPSSAVIPSDGRYQGYAIPNTPGKVRVPAQQTVMLPMDGYCMHPDLPAPPAGALLPDLANWPPHVLPFEPTARQIGPAVQRLKDRGVIHTPSALLEIIPQQVFWSLTTPHYDPCSHLPALLDEAGVPQSQVPVFVAQVVDAVLKTGRELNLPGYAASLPHLLISAGALSPDADELVYTRVTSTGQTTGHIADIAITNPSSRPVNVVIGAGGAAYVPSNGKDQSYVIPSLPVIPVPPRETVTAPLYGYCADVHRPPVPGGNSMPSPREWITSTPTHTRGVPADAVRIPTHTAPPLAAVASALSTQPLPPVASKWNCLPLPAAPGQPLIPGTDIPIRTPIPAAENPGLAVPLLLDAAQRIESAYDKVGGTLSTPFSANPAKQKDAVVQQTLWIYAAALEGKEYTQEDFRDNTVKQFEQNTGRPYADLPTPQKDQLNKGVQDFWEAFTATGAEAKILPQVPEPVPVKPIENGITKPKGNTAVPTLTRAPQQNKPQEPPKEQPPAAQKEECKCDTISFKIVIWRFSGTTREAVQSSSPKTVTASSGDTSKLSAEIIKAGMQGFQKGDQAAITIEDIKITCSCLSRKTPCVPYKDEKQSDAYSKAVLNEKIYREAIEDAKKGYDHKMKELEKESKYKKAKEAFDKAKEAFDEAKKAYDDACKNLAEPKRGNSKQTQTDKLKKKMDDAEEKMKKKEEELNKIIEGSLAGKIKKDMGNYEEELKKAEKAVADNQPGKPSIKNGDGTADAEGSWGNDNKKFTFRFLKKEDDKTKLELCFRITYYCVSSGCEPISCGRTFCVKVEE